MGGTRPVWLVLIFTCLLLLQWLSVCSTSPGEPRCREDERYALSAFKKSFFNQSNCLGYGNASLSKMMSWKTEKGKAADCCNWEGIECDEETGHVIGLDLSSSCLMGTLNSEASIFDLGHLQKLNLADNLFNPSPIPSALGRLTRLTRLNLSSSSFIGMVTSELMTLTNLSSLDLSSNYGMAIPSLEELLGSLNKIEELDLGQLTVLDGKVPRSLANMTSMRSLALRHCGLSGEFPESIFALPGLELLDISENWLLTGRLSGFHQGSPIKSLSIWSTGFSGELPVSLGNLSSLTHLDLRDCGFRGEIPSSISDLTKLTYMDIGGNKFKGRIPASLGNLTSITTLDLSQNQLSGEIPSSLGNLIQLDSLDFSDNQLMGEIPTSLMNLVQLSHLILRSNMLTGNFPSQIMNLTHLTYLDLSYNRLRGPLPSSIYQLQNLYTLNLKANNLNGVARLDGLLEHKGLSEISLSSNLFSKIILPESNTSVPKLGALGLGSCNLTEVPQFLKQQDALILLDLSQNYISGQVPTWLLDLHLWRLDMSHNNLTAFPQHHETSSGSGRESASMTLDLRFNYIQGPLPIPPSFVIDYLISNNRLSGEIPPLICECKNTSVWDLAENSFTGPLPPCFDKFISTLRGLSLSGNNFHGKIPDPKLDKFKCELRMIDLSSNSFQGQLPRSLANCLDLEYVNFGRNNITDTFPSWLGSLPFLKILMLHSNSIHGVMKAPQHNSSFPSLQIIDLSNNNLRGLLPADYFALWKKMTHFSEEDKGYLGGYIPGITMMTIVDKGIEREFPRIPGHFTLVDLSSNNFSGTIPESIGENLLKLHTLNLSNNDLSGPIPIALANLKDLEVLDLSRNRLSGQIPKTLMQITYLEFFNVSYNNLSGAIPQGSQFGTFENSSYIGNPELCGAPLTKKCENPEAPRSPPHPAHDQEEKSGMPFGMDWITILIGLAGGFVTGVALEQSFGACILDWLGKKWRMHRRIAT